MYGTNHWEDIDVLSVNRINSHSKWNAFENKIQAIEWKSGVSKYVKCLDGDFLFKYFDIF